MSLSSTQNDWVENRVKAGFEASNAANSVLLGKRGVQALPNDPERVVRQIQERLTGPQAEFMMQEGRPEFTYQNKLVAPSNRVDLLRALVDGQPRRMGMPGQDQQGLWIWPAAETHLAGRRSRVEAPQWRWELGQGDQLIKTPQEGDDPSLELADRSREFLRSLPVGMRGTDRWTWVARMAAGLKDGKPLDVRFSGNATDTVSYEQWNFTPLDEEGELTEGGNRYRVGGDFYPNHRRANLNGYSVSARSVNARFRASVDGAIQA